MMRQVQVNPVHWSLQLDADLIAWKQLDTTFLCYDPYGRTSTQITSPTERLQAILSNQSLFIRATDLTKFLSKCPPEALKDNFQLIINNLFFSGNREQSWDLRNMRKLEFPNESAALLKLLAADGPIITLALRLMDDHNFLLEFPLEALPNQLQRRLLESDIPPFFANKLGMPQGIARPPRSMQSLMLNPFEYYIFSFASINLLGLAPTGRNTDYLSGWAALQDTLYTNVLEEYLSYYFPCTGSGVPSHNFNYTANHPKETVFMANSLLRQQQQSKHNYGMAGMPQQPSDLQEKALPKLFKPSVLQEQTGPVPQREALFLTTHPSAYKEVWRSETMIHVFMELWMCGYHGALDQVDNFVTTSPMMYGGLPTVEVVKSIRMLVRHLHYFINCVNSHALHPMEEIRRTSFPIFQRRLYTFLRYLFHHWPLDNSFRIVYETWLSYIQPWRYVTIKNPSSREPTIEAPVDRRWFNFLIDNILFYSKILSQILLRLERVDLTATKNALMFYRLAKVFTTHENLKLMLHEIETSILTYETQFVANPASNAPSNTRNSTVLGSSPRSAAVYPTPSGGLASTTVGGYFSGGNLSPIASSPPASQQSSHQDYGLGLSGSAATANATKIAHIKQLMKDLENAYYEYEPIFSTVNTRKIKLLLINSTEARSNLMAAAEKLTAKDVKPFYSLSNFFNTIFSESTSETQIAAAEATEKQKAANHLEFSRNQFAVFFDIQLDDNTPYTNGFGTNSSQSMSSMYFSPDSRPRYSSGIYANNQSSGESNSNIKTILPPGVIVESDLIPHGNPDESHVRSDESRHLVRLLGKVSNFFNYVFEDKIEEIYFSPSLSGRYLRAMLAEPAEYIVYLRKGPTGARKVMKVARYLPPRVHLRACASTTFFIWVFAVMVFSLLLSLSSGGTCVSLLTLYFIYLTFRATSEPVNKLAELQQLRMLYYQVDDDSATTDRPVGSPTYVPSTSSVFKPTSPTSARPEDEFRIHRRNLRFEGAGDSF
ncbi:uncharacterized protein LOC110862046 isoform X2 [Folsomia candida]|uniref:uncharacterized protein LOC110862046 isoform X2 n=1 Tax=Folsomia candida TaxID=158441 RepID=UPI000B8F2C94|nr:uncharacterized protein LOC110862046 isoform X2 [Folsomia candida]